MDLMNMIFRQYLDIFLIVFIDDIFIYSTSKNEDICNFRIAFRILKDQELYEKYRKCYFD